MRVSLARHQLLGTFAHPLSNSASQERAVVQEELQQTQVLAADLTTQREIVTQPGVQVLHHRAAPRCLGHGLHHGPKDDVAFVSHLRAQLAPTLPGSR
jgi:hypothetical protein